jgi:ssRNA-specific RNase YbeY (16S rRNA maturation enzyme)
MGPQHVGSPSLTLKPLNARSAELKDLQENVREEAGEVMRRALLGKADLEPEYKLPRMANLSVVLCGDPHIRALNFQHRNKDAPTDVLSFEMQDELDYKVSCGGRSFDSNVTECWPGFWLPDRSTSL